MARLWTSQTLTDATFGIHTTNTRQFLALNLCPCKICHYSVCYSLARNKRRRRAVRLERYLANHTLFDLQLAGRMHPPS